MIPTSAALDFMFSSIQQIDPRSDGWQVQQQLRNMTAQLGEKHRAVTRYDLNHLPEKLGRTPNDSHDVRLKYCNAFNVAMKAAKQCSGLTVLDGAKWPPENDFKERSKLCKDAIDLFYSKAYEWLEYQSSRRSSYDDFLSRIDDIKAEQQKLDASFHNRHDTLDYTILEHAPPAQENSDDGLVHHVATSKVLSDNPEEDVENTFSGGKHVSFFSRVPRAEPQYNSNGFPT